MTVQQRSIVQSALNTIENEAYRIHDQIQRKTYAVVLEKESEKTERRQNKKGCDKGNHT